MPIREALIAVVAFVMMAPPAVAENANDLKYALERGAAKTAPPDEDSDPIYKTKIGVTDKVIYVVHYAASGETHIRNEQYRELRFWGDEKTDNWSGVSIKRPDWTMVALSASTREASGWSTSRSYLVLASYRQPSPAYVGPSLDQKVPDPVFAAASLSGRIHDHRELRPRLGQRPLGRVLIKSRLVTAA